MNNWSCHHYGWCCSTGPSSLIMMETIFSLNRNDIGLTPPFNTTTLTPGKTYQVCYNILDKFNSKSSVAGTLLVDGNAISQSYSQITNGGPTFTFANSVQSCTTITGAISVIEIV